MQNNALDMPYFMPERSFAVVLMLAFTLHLLAFTVWHLMPKPAVQDIPIRIMNIRLGGDEEVEDEPQGMAAPTGNTPQVEAIINQISRDTALQKPRSKSDTARQYVREVNRPTSQHTTRTKASGARDAEMMSRYTQLISLWIQKFKIYPAEAQSQGIKGDTVVRIRIDRRGNVRYYALERTTGNQVLDRAAIDMIRRANPVPAIPDEYPEGELQEFLIPVSFK